MRSLRTGAVTRLIGSGVKRAVVRLGTEAAWSGVAYSLTQGSKESILVIPEWAQMLQRTEWYSTV